MDFYKWKDEKLSKDDLSRKGSVDGHVLEAVSRLNSLPQYFTTSSCSGRIILFENEQDSSVSCQKKGCKWLYVSHEFADSTAVLESLKSIEGDAVIKFEPMVMHIQCCTIKDAQKLHQASVASGFRNSGLTIGNKGKIMLAVRSTHGLEAPVSSKGCLIVSEQYIEFLVQSANNKMKENFTRISRFLENVKLIPANHDLPSSVLGKKKCSLSSRPKEEFSKPLRTRLNQASLSEAEQNISNTDFEEGFTDFLFENT